MKFAWGQSVNTTNLFVELVVIGVGATLWLTLLMFSVFGYKWVPWDKVTSASMLIPLLSITYVLGIIMDRLADQLYVRWDGKLRKKEFPSDGEYYSARTYVYSHATDRIIALFEYGRSRLRISRAWSINCSFLSIGIPLFFWTRFPQMQSSTRIGIVAFSVAIFGLGAMATWFAWKKLALNDYRRLAETNTFLRREQRSENDIDDSV